jgi:hypothetical protein
MSGRRVGRLVSDTAESVIAFAADAANSVQSTAVLLFAAFATLLAVAAIPILIRADMPSVGVNSILKCYDRAGNYEPCPVRASASQSRFNGARVGTDQPASWAATALYLQESRAIIAADQPANGKTSAPSARRSTAPQKRTASAICGRHLIPCIFSAFRKGVTHLASVAATEAKALQARGLKERYRQKDL